MRLKNKKRLFWLLVKIAAFFGVFLFIALTLLSRLGGTSDIYKTSIEQYLTETTGYKAHVGKLNMVTFFPVTRFDFENLTLGQNAITADKFFASMNFWDITTHSGKIRALAVENMRAAAGIIFAPALHLKSIHIAEPYLMIDGAVGVTDFILRVPMKSWGDNPKTYSLDREKPYHLQMGGIDADFMFAYAPKTGLQFGDLVLRNGGKTVLSGDLAYAQAGEAGGALTGKILAGGHAMDLDLKISGPADSIEISGSITADSITPEDFAPGSDLAKTVRALARIFEWKESGGDTISVSGRAAPVKNFMPQLQKP